MVQVTGCVKGQIKPSLVLIKNGSLSYFNINNVTNIRAWYDATDITTITQATGVSIWRDKSANAYNLAQATGASQPVYFTSGGSRNLPFIRFTSGKNMIYNLSCF